VCNKTFSEKSVMKKHQLIHSGQRPYACDVCNKTFTQKSNMKTHQLIHSR
jgi:KRAB domain-containing zinc finger protein